MANLDFPIRALSFFLIEFSLAYGFGLLFLLIARLGNASEATPLFLFIVSCIISAWVTFFNIHVCITSHSQSPILSSIVFGILSASVGIGLIIAHLKREVETDTGEAVCALQFFAFVVMFFISL